MIQLRWIWWQARCPSIFLRRLCDLFTVSLSLVVLGWENTALAANPPRNVAGDLGEFIIYFSANLSELCDLCSRHR